MTEMNGLALMGLAPPQGRASPLKQGEVQGTAEVSAFAAILGAVGLLQVPSAPEAEQSLMGGLAIAFTRPDRNAEAGIANPEATETAIDALAGEAPQGVAVPQPTLAPNWGASAPAFEAAPALAAAPSAGIAAVLTTPRWRTPSGAGLAVASEAVAALDASVPTPSPAEVGGVTQLGPDGVPVLTTSRGGTPSGVGRAVVSELVAALGASVPTPSPAAANEVTPVGPDGLPMVATSSGGTPSGVGRAVVSGLVAALGASVPTPSPAAAGGVAKVRPDGLAESASSVEAKAERGVSEQGSAPASSASPTPVATARGASEVVISAEVRALPQAATDGAPPAAARSTAGSGDDARFSSRAGLGESALGSQAEAGEFALSPVDSVQRAVRVDGQELRLLLNLPDIGRVEVRVRESSDGVRISLTASTREAGELIQQYLPVLQISLEARGLQVDRLDVTVMVLTDGDSDGELRDHAAADDQGEDGPVWSPLAGQSSHEDGTGDGGVTVDRGRPRLGEGTLDVLA